MGDGGWQGFGVGEEERGEVGGGEPRHPGSGTMGWVEADEPLLDLPAVGPGRSGPQGRRAVGPRAAMSVRMNNCLLIYSDSRLGGCSRYRGEEEEEEE